MTAHAALQNQLAEWLAGTDLTILELSGPATAFRLRRHGAGAAFETEPWPPAVTPAAAAATVVCAGTVGIVLLAHPLRTEPLVRIGQTVAAGQTIGLLKIGLVLLAVHAPHEGTVTRIVAPHETAVGFGDPLLEIA